MRHWAMVIFFNFIDLSDDEARTDEFKISLLRLEDLI